MKPVGLTPQPRNSALPWVVSISAVTFSLGVMGTMYLNQSRANDQAQMMAALLVQMQQQGQGDVTRAAAPQDLMSVSAITQATPVVATAPAEPVVEVAALTEVVAAEPEITETTENGITTTYVSNGVEASTANTAPLEARIAEARALAARIRLDRLSDGRVIDLLTEGVVAGNYTVETQAQDGRTSGVVLVPHGHENTAGLLSDILRDAAQAGTFEVPGYHGSEGELDSQTLLFDLVERSLERGSPEEAAAARQLRIAAFEASSARSEVVGGERYYTVEAGDSLAYISLQFYGSTGAYNRIFEANRAILTSPDKIQVGQRLVIPNA